MSDSPTADALLALGRSRDAAAWAWLVERHGDAVQRLARRIVEDPQLADDACQEAFLAVRDSAPSFRPPGDGAEAAAIGWLMRVACNTALKTARSRQRRRRREAALPEEQPMPEPESPRDPELTRAIARELARLPERHRLPLHLHFHAGLAYPELAAAMRVSVNAARVRVHRALAALRQRLAVSTPSLSVAVLAERLGDAGPAVKAHHSDLIRLLDSPRHAATRGIFTMATISIGAGIAACVALTVILAAQGGEAPPAPPAPSVVAPAFNLAPKDWPELEIHCDFQDDSLADVADFVTRVLRVPMRVDPAVLAAQPSPVTLTVDHTKLRYVLDLLGRFTGLNYRIDSDGGCYFSKLDLGGQPAVKPRAYPPNDERTFRFTARDLTEPEFLRAFYAAGGWRDPNPVTEYGDDRISFRGEIHDGLTRHDPFLAAAMKGYAGGTPMYGRLLGGSMQLPAFRGSLAEALALVSRLSGLPCRLDDDSGPAPRLVLPAGRIGCRRLLARIAGASDMRFCEASDGMVFFRPRRYRFVDAAGHGCGEDRKPYSEDHPAWWGFAQRVAKTPEVVIRRTVGDSLIAVSWREVPLRDVAGDLQRALGVPVRLEVDDAIAATPILLVLDERQLGDVLICLAQASGCVCEIIDNGSAIRIARKAEDQPAPAAPADAPKEPQPAPAAPEAPRAPKEPAPLQPMIKASGG